MKSYKKPNYELKAKVLKLGLDKEVKYLQWKNYDNAINGIVNDQETDNKYIDFIFKYGYEIYQEGVRISKADYNRKTRLNSRITQYLTMGHCIFATLTFNDDVLNNTNEQTRRKYVSRFLKSISSYYVANIDYGKTNEREHYHALIVTDWVSDKWDYGFAWLEHVNLGKKNTNKKLSDYINKLTNHAIKDTTRRPSIIYSKPIKDKA